MRKIKDINCEVGANIRKIRTAAGHTQEHLSEILGITPNHLSAIERGFSALSLEYIKKICMLYAVTADDLLFGETTDSPTDELDERLKNIKPEYRPQINKVLLAMLEALSMQEDSKSQ